MGDPAIGRVARWHRFAGGAMDATDTAAPARALMCAMWPSRYRVYRYEVEQGYVGDLSAGGESGAHACYGGDLPAAPDAGSFSRLLKKYLREAFGM